MKRTLVNLLLLLAPQLLLGQVNLDWVKQYATTTTANLNLAYISKIALDAELNVYTTGTYQGMVDFDPGPGTFYCTANGHSDIYVTKLDSSGNFTWSKQITSGYNKNVFSLSVDSLENIVIGGQFRYKADFDPGIDSFFIDVGQNYASYICKLDKNGDFIWAKAFTNTINNNNSSVCETRSHVTDNYGNIFCTGDFADTIDFDGGPAVYNLSSTYYSGDVFITKLDSTGSLIWAKQLTDSSNDSGNGITVDGNGDLILTGVFKGNLDLDPGPGVHVVTAAGDFDIFILKLDKFGNYTWGGKIGDIYDDEPFPPKTDPEGNIYLTGTFKGSVDFDPDNSSLFTMTSYNYSNDIFIMKLNAAGNLLWAKQIGGLGTEIGVDLNLDAANNVYVTGQFQSGDFDPGVDSVLLYAVGSSDIFIVKLDSLGNFKWANAFGGTGGDAGYAVALDSLNNVYLGGLFDDTASFSTGGIPYNLFAIGAYDAFVLKLNQTPLGINYNLAGSNIAYSLFPNPVKEQLTINFDNDVSMQLILRDVLAREVLSKRLYKRNSIDVGYLDKGLYLYEMRNETGIVKTGKLVKN